MGRGGDYVQQFGADLAGVQKGGWLGLAGTGWGAGDWGAGQDRERAAEVEQGGRGERLEELEMRRDGIVSGVV
jgi:hypothetical protein